MSSQLPLSWRWTLGAGSVKAWLAGLCITAAGFFLTRAAWGDESRAPSRPETNDASPEVVEVIKKAELPEPAQAAMLAVLTEAPRGNRWSGQTDTVSFAMAARPLPTGQARAEATPLLLSAVHMLAVEDLLLTRAVLDAYRGTGLTDPMVLRKAVARSAEQIGVTGRVKGAIHEARPQGPFAVAYVVCDTSQLCAHLLQAPELGLVRDAYRELMHEQMRDLMKHREWKEALGRWEHLRDRKLLSPPLALDAARCFKELKQPSDTLRVLAEAMDRFAGSLSADWLEQMGDLALELGEPGEDLARRAYEKASDLLRNTRTGVTKSP
jgi:hypothetical protein